MFFGVLEGFSDHISFTVIPFDTNVNEVGVFEWKKGKRIKPSRVCTGGTNFNAPTKWVNNRSFDGHIIFTDMEAEKPASSKCKRIWVVPKKKRLVFRTKEKIIELLPDN